MTSAKTSRRRVRAARLRAEQRRRERRRNLLLGAAATVATLTVTGAVAASFALRGGGAAIPGVLTFGGLARTHVTGTVSYPQQPPAGGPHSPVWLNCGVYAAPVPSANAVHSQIGRAHV